jgi:hypothetical protein
MKFKTLSILSISTSLLISNAFAGESLDKLKKYLAADNIGDKQILVEQELYSQKISGDYVYIAYKAKNKKEVVIEGNQTGGTRFTDKTCKTKIRYDKNKSDADKNKKPYFVIGFDGLSAKHTKDVRTIEHRIYCSKATGKNLKIEMVLKTSAGEKVNEFSWADAMKLK